MAKQVGWYPGMGVVAAPFQQQAGAPSSDGPMAAPMQGIDPPVQFVQHLVLDSSGRTVPLSLGGLGGQSALPIALVNRAGNPVTLAPQTAPPPVGAIVGRDTDQDLVQSVDTKIAFNRVDRDVGGFWCECHPEELVIPQPGRYTVSFDHEENDTGDTTMVEVKVKKNGTAIMSQWSVFNANKWYASKTAFPQLAAGDVLTLEVNSDGVAAKAKGGSTVPLFEVMFYSV